VAHTHPAAAEAETGIALVHTREAAADRQTGDGKGVLLGTPDEVPRRLDAGVAHQRALSLVTGTIAAGMGVESEAGTEGGWSVGAPATTVVACVFFHTVSAVAPDVLYDRVLVDGGIR
jgi:hypothetical protein